MSGTVTPLRPRRKCPECGRASSQAEFPFCSTRCKSVDLNRWLSGAYVIAGKPDDEPDRSPDGSGSGEER